MDTPTPTWEGVATYHTYLDGLVQQAGTLTKPTCCRTSRSAADLDLSAVPLTPSMCSGSSGSSDYSQLYAQHSPSLCLHATASKSATSPTPTTSAFSTLNTNSTMMAALDSGFGIIDDTKKDTSMTPSSPPSSSSSSVSLFHASKSSNSIAASHHHHQQQQQQQQQHQVHQQAAPFFDFDTGLASPRLRFESTSDNIFHFDDDVFPTTTAATATADGGAINVGGANASQSQGNDGALLPAFTLNSDIKVEKLLSHADMNLFDAALESFLSSFSSTSSSSMEERQASAASSASALSAASFSSNSSDAEDLTPWQPTSHTATSSSSSSSSSLPSSTSSPAHRRKSKRAQRRRGNNSSVRAKGTASTMMRGRSAINKRCVLENGEIDHEKLERTREIARRSYWRRRNQELTGRRTVRQRLTLLNKTKDLLVQKRQRLLKERQALLDHVRQYLHTLHPIGTIDQHPSPLF
ncbi:hypothetical protein PTSG_07658 [Salpingoeca rosetta]|uniref:Uncharacterized protein n=1 Tax=Salpingoeca rosetta (strain ATCC 50818 / BSB-021) TaxID=946362 RepID=F2UHE4_SALR5|nr:uncharacterized protein PTSG_07658 [Salpingoeca rosetta]EGD76543.1 hypothetical protein PTSG_07658 [Salpingoeca rosetta]|eukprot:XP_004991457.1 hypothetical protein PTSG_07658 [Salpingoeca rosetta]